MLKTLILLAVFLLFVPFLLGLLITRFTEREKNNVMFNLVAGYIFALGLKLDASQKYHNANHGGPSIGGAPVENLPHQNCTGESFSPGRHYPLSSIIKGCTRCFWIFAHYGDKCVEGG